MTERYYISENNNSEPESMSTRQGSGQMLLETHDEGGGPSQRRESEKEADHAMDTLGLGKFTLKVLSINRKYKINITSKRCNSGHLFQFIFIH